MRSQARKAWLFLLPALVFYAVFLVFPVLSSLYLSFHEWNMLTSPLEAPNVGLQNYAHIFRDDPVFLKALWNTLLFVIVSVPLSIALSVGAALLMSRRRHAGLWRLIFFLPTITPAIAVGMVWRYLYRPNYGLINTLLNAAGVSSQPWLNDPSTALMSIIITAVWAGIGSNLLIVDAGMRDIAEEYYEAAAIDGATSWAKLRHITLPLLKPTLLFVFVTGTIASWQVFDFVVAMTAPTLGRAGGPVNSTMTLVVYMYQTAFEYLNMGRASAMAWVLFFIVMALSLVQLRAFWRGGVENY